MTTFRFGLVSAGRMGRTHIRALAPSELVAVTAIAEVSEQRPGSSRGIGRDAAREPR